MSESIWSEVAALLLKGFLGVVVVSSAGLAALKACELLSRYIVAYSRAVVVGCFWEISFDEQTVILVSGSGHGGGISF